MKKLDVRLSLGPGDERLVGQLAESGPGRVIFEYDSEFLREPLWLSPFKLPPEPGLVQHRDLAFGPLFGLFDDSLPDGWGLLLMDRFFQQQRLVLSEVSPLDRLAYLGTRTMGALTYHPPSDPQDYYAQILDLQEMARAAKQVLRGSTAEVLPQLLRAGGSPGGARPKVLVGVRGDELRSGEGRLPSGFDPWIIKFHSEGESLDAGAIELAYSVMAGAAGITMPPTRCFETAKGERFFGVERFDRLGDRRFHVHTFGNLIHSNFRVPECDYRQLLEVTRILTKNHHQVIECFRRMVFNALAHNRDDHAKNFAFRLTHDGDWELTPAYDLVFASGPGGEHSMTLAGEGRAPDRSHLTQLAETVGISSQEADSILEAVATAVECWPEHARRADVSRKSLAEIEVALGDCLGRVV